LEAARCTALPSIPVSGQNSFPSSQGRRKEEEKRKGAMQHLAPHSLKKIKEENQGSTQKKEMRERESSKMQRWRPLQLVTKQQLIHQERKGRTNEERGRG
jgi:hypothetical protein